MKAGLLLSLLVSVIAFGFVYISSRPKAKKLSNHQIRNNQHPTRLDPQSSTSPSVEGNKKNGQPRPALPSLVFCKALINIGVAHGRPSQKYMHMMLYRPHPLFSHSRLRTKATST